MLSSDLNRAPSRFQEQLQLLDGKLEEACRRVVASAGRLGPTEISHAELSLSLDLTKIFYSGTPGITKYMLDQFSRISEQLLPVEGVLGVFGLGYPLYAISKNTEGAVELPEIYSFLDEIGDKLKHDRQVNDRWPCIPCQINTDLQDLKTKCSPCNLVTLRPRDLFKALPDIDVVIVVKTPGESTEVSILVKLMELGYFQSDIDIGGAIIRTQETLSSVIKGQQPQFSLPIDAHIWSVADFEAGLERILKGEEQEVMITDRALHMTWESGSLNFLFDFAFSLTPFSLGEDLQEVWNRGVKDFAALYNSSNIEDLIKKLSGASPRAKRLFEDPKVRDIFIRRWVGSNVR